MRIATLVKGTGADFEQRKLQLARRDMDQAYKKNAKYTNATKNPMLLVLENLLSGKTEKELHAKDLAIKQQEVFEEQLSLSEVNRDIKVSADREETAFNQAHKEPGTDVTDEIMYSTVPNGQKYVIHGEEAIQEKSNDSLQETIEMLEKIRQAALTPVNPSPQELRIAVKAEAQIQLFGKLKNEVIEEHEGDRPPFEDESFNVEIPERFLTNVERNAEADTIFGKDLEKLLFNRTFNKAKSVYTSHIEMVKNSYHLYNESLFSRTA